MASSDKPLREQSYNGSVNGHGCGNMTYQMWAEHNRLLYNTSTIDEFKGLESLELSIKIELDRGLYHSLFIHITFL